jgi:hypothetical protein
MAYNSTTGSQMSGDIRYENDPEDTQIDFENDSITLRAGGANNFVISTTSIAASVLLSSSMPISASSFWVDGVQVSGGGTPGGSSTQVQYNNGGSFAGSANLTFNGTTLTAAGISSTGNTTLGDAGADSVTINAATVNIPNVAAGTDNTVVVYNGTTLVTDEIDSRVWGSTLVDATGTPVANQIATWSDANTAQGLATLTYDGTTLAITGSISGSGNISGSAFYGSGANLTGLPSAAITTYNNSTDNRVITSVNSTTVQGEANLTFDGSTLSVTGDMSGSGVLSADQIKCSGSVAAVSFAGDGSALTGLPSAAIATYNTSGDNRIITSVDATTVQGEANLTFDGTTLAVVGASSRFLVTGSAEIIRGLSVGIGTPSSTGRGDGIFTTDISGSSTATFRVFEQYSAGAKLAHISGSGQISASSGITGSALHTEHTVINATHVSSSLNISGAAFYGSGANLIGLPSAAISTYSNASEYRVITSVNATSVQGEADLTFSGSTLGLTGLFNAQHTAVPAVRFTHPTANASGAVIELLNSRAGGAGQAADFCGGVTFKAQDSTSVETQYSKISSKISSPTNSSEAGLMIFEVTTGGTSGTTYLTLDGGTSIITASAAISCSVGITASAFVGDGSGLTGIAGGGTPGGADGQVQYNNGGSFGGEAELVYDDINNRLGVGTAVPTHTLSVTGSAAISGDLTVSGSLRSAKRIEMTTHYFQYGGASTTFIPFGYGTSDDATSPTGKNQFIAPCSGSLKKLMVRTVNTQNGHATASLWVGNDGTDDFGTGGSVVEHVTASMASANTTYTFNFTGTSHFTSSQIVGVAFDFRLNPGAVNMTCVWEYDDREL